MTEATLAQLGGVAVLGALLACAAMALVWGTFDDE